MCLARDCARALAALTIGLVCSAMLAAQDDVTLLEQEAVRRAVERVSSSVVRIETFGGLERIGSLLVGTGPTTGVVISEDGYILSSAFNFVQQPSSILVTLPGGSRETAQIVARDKSRMLVLLKVEDTGTLVVPEFSTPQQIQVGQWSIAVGRTFDKDVPNISVGIISAKNRIWGKAVQTDAKISPSNYGGPLIDIHGRVQGILVPLSPQGRGEVAGAQWYDSGIGFAVPLAEVMPRLPQLKEGQDLVPGLLGVSLTAGDENSLPAEIVACPVKSPARAAGLQVGDVIVEIDGQHIERQSQLRHALGPKYAGDEIKLVALRDKDRVSMSITLVDQIEPFQHAFLGLLPMRIQDDQAGPVVRYVYADSPAATAGMQPGDRLVSLGGKEISDVDAALQAMAAYEPNAEIQLRFIRGDQTFNKQVVLSRLPTTTPESLPPAYPDLSSPIDPPPPTGVIEVKLPEEPNECFALVPDSYDARVPHGLVVWLESPGRSAREQLVDQWRDTLAAHDLILLAPKPADPARWSATEVDVIRKTIEQVMDQYSIDRMRIAVHGHQAGGAMSYLVAFAHRDLVRAAAPIDAPIPLRSVVPANDPVERLAIYSVSAAKSRMADRIKASTERLRKMKYPVTELPTSDRQQFARWLDALDRI